MQIGYYGIPGTCRTTSTHVVLRGTPICRYRPSSEYEFQWCSNNLDGTVAIECAGCLKVAARIAEEERQRKMKPIKFETIKLNAIREFNHRMGANGELIGVEATPFLALVAAAGEKAPKSPRRILKEWTDYGVTLIEKWDVRRVLTLVELFPSSIPKGWTGKRLVAEMLDNPNSDWVVFPA